MRRFLSILCATCISLCASQAEVLLTEHFDRSLGTLSASTWSSGTIPNDSNWHTYSPGSVQFQVVNQQLYKTDYCSATSGKAVQYTANHSRDYILFPQAVSSVAGEKVYMAFLLKADGLQTTSNAKSATNANNSILAFAINASNNALGSLNGRVLIQTVDENTFHLGVTRRGETPQFAPNTLKINETYLIVAEYCFISGEKNDLVNLYINPTPVDQTAAVTSVNTSTASADADELVGIALCSNGNTPTNMILDEIKVASSWAEIWEDSTTPTPSIIAKNTLDFGKVFIEEPAEKSIEIKGENLKSAIQVVSNSALLVPAVSSISISEAQAGFNLSLTLTPQKVGEGKAEITLSSNGASDRIIEVTWDAAKPVPAAGTELLLNGSFEQYSCNAMFGCSFDDWTWNGSGASAEQTDKIEGEVAMHVQPTIAGVLDQAVTLNDADYATGTRFELTLHYKVLSLPTNGKLELDCFWEAASGGDAEATKAHDEDVLQRILCDSITSQWQTAVIATTKPTKSTYFRVRMKAPKNANILFDDCSLVQKESTEPFILVKPNSVNAVETTIGNSIQMATIHITQGNLTGTTTFELSYTNADQFQLSRTSLSANQSECDLVITYAPTTTGTHQAVLNIDNINHPSLFQSIKLNGTCTDPTQKPTITVTPSVVPTFECVVEKQHKQTIHVSSANCTDYIYLHVDHIQGEAFIVGNSMLAKNSEADVDITFSPDAAGSYQSKLTIYSTNAESVVLTLNGTATAPSPQDIDWATEFSWNLSNPLTLLNETFDGVTHNNTLLIQGWQNVAEADVRPWWGYDESVNSTPSSNKCAKATAYKIGKPSTGNVEMWLVTPALDYKNAASQVFRFSVMGQYMPTENNPTALEIYYIDATNPADVYKQDLTSGFSIPKTSDENNTWIPFELHLENQPIADVFFMAFRYVGPNGNEGVVTYYIDDVSWGLNTTGIDNNQLPQPAQKILHNGHLLILRANKTYTIDGQLIHE